MLLRCLFLVAISCSASWLSAQVTDPDSVRIEGHFNQLGQHCYRDLDSTLHYLELLLADTRQLEWTEEEAYAYLWGILCTGYHDQIDLKYDLLTEAESLLAKKGAELDPETRAAIDLDLRLHWGDYYMETGGYEGALEIYEPIADRLAQQEQLSDEAFQRLVVSYQYLAAIHRRRGSYRESIDYAFRALQSERQYYASRGESGGDESMAYSRIAGAYWLMGERALALTYYRPAFESVLNSYRADPEGQSRVRKRLINMGLELGRYYRQLERPDSARYFLQKVRPLTTPENMLQQEIRLEGARVAALQGQSQTARDTLKQAIGHLESGPAAGTDILRGRLFSALGDIERAAGRYAEALQAYQQALTGFHSEFTSLDLRDNPTPSVAMAPRELLYALTRKTDLLLQEAAAGPSQDLETAWASARTGMDLVDSILVAYTSDYDKQYLLDDSYALFELALQIIHRGGDAYMLRAFEVMERSKSVALFAAVRDLHAREFAGVPQEALEKMQRLRYRLARIDARIREGGSEVRQTEYREQQRELQRAYRAMIRSFESEYPDYYRLKYDRRVVDLPKLRNEKLIAEDQLLVQYFLGDRQLYAFAYDGRNQSGQLHQLPWNTDLQDWAAELKTDIYERNDAGFRQKARALYQALLEPLLGEDPPPRLLVIPDGILGYLPFDLLLSGPVAEDRESDFRRYPFLLNTTAVSQCFSVSLLREMQRHQYRTGGLLAIAPSFPDGPLAAALDDRAALGELLFNRQEAASALQWYEGQLIEQQQATKQRFLELSRRYRIYHIATHAVVDDRSPHRSFIAFSEVDDSSREHSRLYNYEILACHFPAELVVLSACETGVGKLLRGEGIMSLARAFSYAGAASLVTSLWNINDQSGQQLMGHFYRELKDGQTKDEALRLAKMAYLQQAPDKARTHPVYWGAFLPAGDMRPLQRPGGWYRWGLAALLAAGMLFFFRVRSVRRNQ